MTGSDRESASLERDLGSLKREVDALQIEVMASVKPWYQQVSTLIALSALVFSLGTTAVSYYRAAQQDLLASRLELRNLVEKLTNIPENHARMLRDYAGDPRTISQLSAMVNTRNLVLARQAQAAIARIESSLFGRGSVIGVEYTAVATALTNSFVYDQAAAYHQEAARRAIDPASAAGALRSSAGVAMARQDIASMRRLMEKARAIFDEPRFRSVPQITKDVTNATTEFQWAQGELLMRSCQLAAEHAANAKDLLLRIPESQIRTQIMQLSANVEQKLKSCTEIP